MGEPLEGEMSRPKVSRSVSASGDALLYTIGDTQFPPVLLMAHPSMRKMAIRLVQTTTARTLSTSKSNLPQVCLKLVVLLNMMILDIRSLCLQVKQKYRLVELCENVRWNKFKDGWPNIFIDDVQNIAGRDGKYCLLERSPSVFLLQVGDAHRIVRYGCVSWSVYIIILIS